jgi:NAD(P)-dependent dehydrogenase (short-subunit alcohol dehydrogenase family)
MTEPERTDRRLAGSTALVTGGGRGLGRAIAQALGSAGAAVAIAARSPDELAVRVGDRQKARKSG